MEVSEKCQTLFFFFFFAVDLRPFHLPLDGQKKEIQEEEGAPPSHLPRLLPVATSPARSRASGKTSTSSAILERGFRSPWKRVRERDREHQSVSLWAQAIFKSSRNFFFFFFFETRRRQHAHRSRARDRIVVLCRLQVRVDITEQSPWRKFRSTLRPSLGSAMRFAPFFLRERCFFCLAGE